jgi:hypothetical protein
VAPSSLIAGQVAKGVEPHYIDSGAFTEWSELMSKVIVTDLGHKAGAHSKKTGVRTRTVHGSDGRARKVMSLDLNSTTFDDDLTYVFERNVAKARRENKKLLGSADGTGHKK